MKLNLNQYPANLKSVSEIFLLPMHLTQLHHIKRGMKQSILTKIDTLHEVLEEGHHMQQSNPVVLEVGHHMVPK